VPHNDPVKDNSETRTAPDNSQVPLTPNTYKLSAAYFFLAPARGRGLEVRGH